jgi:hypothetical protein
LIKCRRRSHLVARSRMARRERELLSAPVRLPRRLANQCEEEVDLGYRGRDALDQRVADFQLALIDHTFAPRRRSASASACDLLVDVRVRDEDGGDNRGDDYLRVRAARRLVHGASPTTRIARRWASSSGSARISFSPDSCATIALIAWRSPGLPHPEVAIAVVVEPTIRDGVPDTAADCSTDSILRSSSR